MRWQADTSLTLPQRKDWNWNWNLQNGPHFFLEKRITSSAIMELLVFFKHFRTGSFFLYYVDISNFSKQQRSWQQTPLGASAMEPVIKFLLRNSFRWFVTPWVACTLAIGAWWFWARQWTPKKKHMGKLALLKCDVCVLKGSFFPNIFSFFCPTTMWVGSCRFGKSFRMARKTLEWCLAGHPTVQPVCRFCCAFDCRSSGDVGRYYWQHESYSQQNAGLDRLLDKFPVEQIWDFYCHV